MMRMFLALGLALVPLAATADESCLATPKIEQKTRLSQLSDIYFGDSSFRFALLLATNLRTDDPQFNYISDINALPTGGNVCIPQIDEALRLKTRYDRYVVAVRDMAVAEPFEVVETLDPLPQTGSYKVASWIRASAISRYPVGQDVTLGSDVWVTLEPHLGDFCSAYAADVAGDDRSLALRVEQRLGLPPGSTNSHFVTFEVSADGAGAAIFRPCGNSATDTTTCSVGQPAQCAAGDTTCEAHSDFFYRQYYNAFGTEHPVEYPWTSLGYTFDWAPTAVGFSGETGYVRVGESEYVIPSGTTVKVSSVVTTKAYCGG